MTSVQLSVHIFVVIILVCSEQSMEMQKVLLNIDKAIQCPTGKLILHLQCEHLKTFRGSTLYCRNRSIFIWFLLIFQHFHFSIPSMQFHDCSVHRTRVRAFRTQKVSFVVDTLSIGWHFVVNAFDAKFKRHLALRIWQNEANEAWRDKRKTFNTPNRHRMPSRIYFSH